ncbi:MAG TPA: acetyl-CoA C-acyltransferase [Candidatus Dormibacteraeota bacterium]|jgi:acetyl-CoA C-acetyltransferase|nr:acetyl-CoA C-acyltransferase [Candidatus Dormibacteraeota bacterium]
MPEAVIVAAGRSPIGRAGKGALVDVRPDDMVGYVVGKVLEKVPELAGDQLDDLICGCGYPAGEQGMNIGRQAVFLSGLPASVPGTTVNRFCASSLQAIRMAYHAVKSGEGDAFVCAGVESYSRVGRGGMSDEDKNPRLMGADACAQGYMLMGITAENVADQFGVSRQDMDVFALGSQKKAAAARDSGVFDREIIPITTPAGDAVFRDDGIRPDTTLEKLASLEPVFREGGRVTAGNACPLNDGAAAVVVLSGDRAAQLGLKPLARIVASSVSGVDPTIMGVGPIEAVRKVLKATGMTVNDIDVVELNEAFASQVLAVSRELEWDMDRLNPHGGAIALGHPFGMTGARIMTALLNDLATLDATYGLETMCVGGGQGMAMIVERLN